MWIIPMRKKILIINENYHSLFWLHSTSKMSSKIQSAVKFPRELNILLTGYTEELVLQYDTWQYSPEKLQKLFLRLTLESRFLCLSCSITISQWHKIGEGMKKRKLRFLAQTKVKPNFISKRPRVSFKNLNFIRLLILVAYVLNKKSFFKIL